MAALVLGVATEQPVTVDEAGFIDTSFPGFAALMNGVGARCRRRDARPGHRDRRTCRGGEGHAGAADRRGAWAALSGHRPAVSRRRPARAGCGRRPGRPGGGRGRGAALRPDDLERDDLRGPEADAAAAAVAAIPAVRAALLDFQRGFATAQGAVLDGRDIGTVIFPDATASCTSRPRWRNGRGGAGWSFGPRAPRPTRPQCRPRCWRAIPATRRTCAGRRMRWCWIRRQWMPMPPSAAPCGTCAPGCTAAGEPLAHRLLPPHAYQTNRTPALSDWALLLPLNAPS